MTILFLCVANSARSQIAEGLARKLFGASTQVFSAGCKATKVNPLAVAVMKEIEIDISGHRSKSVEDVGTQEISLVITLCQDEVCPAFLNRAKKLHWPFQDPGGSLENFREVRDAIKARLEEFILENPEIAGHGNI
ncbi:MAG: arsenate reductase ArsC [Pseudomonadota bacterium]|nr:arsenate reductase ArsC [Pseudomonadota bacterium]